MSDKLIKLYNGISNQSKILLKSEIVGIEVDGYGYQVIVILKHHKVAFSFSTNQALQDFMLDFEGEME